MLCESWIQSAIQHSCVLGTVGAQCIAMALHEQGAQKISILKQSQACCEHVYPIFLVSTEVFSPFFNYLFVIKYRYCMLCFILGFWNMQFLTVCIWILHNFAPFVLGGKSSTCAVWNMPHGAASVQVHKYHQPTVRTSREWEPWEPSIFSFTHVTGRQGRRWKIVSDIEEKSHGILRNSMNEGNIIRIQASKNIYIRKRLPRFPRFLQGLAVQANALSEISFHRALRPTKLWRRTLQINWLTGLKKSASKTMTTSAQVME